MHPRRGLLTVLLLFLAARPALAAPEDFTNAVNSVQDAAEGVDCAWELARSDLERGVGNVGVKVPCLVRVNVSSAGEQSTHGGSNSINPVLSADGRFVAYLSRASNLVAGDTNNSDDIFLYERAAETTTRGSVSSAGAQSNGPNLNPWLSEDGRHLLWRTDGGGLPGSGIRVVGRDRDTDEDGAFDEPGAAATTLVGSSGGGPRTSPDGRFVAFTTGGSVTGGGSDSNGANDVYLVDRDFDEDGLLDEGGAGYKAVRASVTAAGAQGSGTSTTSDRLTTSTGASTGTPSADGRWIVFSARFTNLVADDANGKIDVFMRDRDVNGDGVFDEPGDTTTFAISRTAGGATADGLSARAFMSPDARWVVYTSDATNLPGVGDSGGFLQVILHDRDTDEDGTLDEPGFTSNRRISQTAEGVGCNGDCVSYLAVSPSGRWIAYDSEATNIVPEDTNATRDIYLHDRDADGDGTFDEPGQTSTVVASRNTQTGAAGNGLSQLAHVVDGPLVSFESAASNLVGDTNNVADAFVWDGDAGAAP